MRRGRMKLYKYREYTSKTSMEKGGESMGLSLMPRVLLTSEYSLDLQLDMNYDYITHTDSSMSFEQHLIAFTC